MKEDNEVKIEGTPKEKFDRIQREFEELRQDLAGVNQKVIKNFCKKNFLF